MHARMIKLIFKNIYTLLNHGIYEIEQRNHGRDWDDWKKKNIFEFMSTLTGHKTYSKYTNIL